MSVSQKFDKEPYMAMAGFSRVSGRTNLHGVDYPSGHFIVLRVYQGKVLRETTSDFYMSDHRAPIVEVAMSEVQFAQLISSFNIGDGVPCTFKARPVEGAEIIQIDMPSAAESTEEKFTADVRETAKDAVDATKQALVLLNEILAGKTVSKAQVREIQAAVETVDRELDRNLPFILKRADEAIGKRTLKSKAEVEAYAQHGGAALADEVRGHVLIEDQTTK